MQVENFKIIRVGLRTKERQEDVVVRESPLTIFLNGEELVTLLSTPIDLKYLAVGFLATEGFIKEKEDIKEIDLDQEKGVVRIEVVTNLIDRSLNKRIIIPGRGLLFYSAIGTTNCSIVQSKMKIQNTEVFSLMEEFQKGSLLFKETGGVHSCALAQDGKIIKFSEDISRHNALDKILGECFLKGISLEDKIILTSGRISSEILMRVAKWGIPMIISLGAPTNLSIRLAEKLGITLIGFVREERMNIYSHSERVIVNEALNKV